MRRTQGRYEVCLILRTRHRRRAWSLPKGHLAHGEEPAAAALREVEEETGLRGELLAPLGAITYQFTQPGTGALVPKSVTFFLMRVIGGSLQPQDTEEVVEGAWVPLDRALEHVAYENERRVLEQARELLARPEIAGRIPDDPTTFLRGGSAEGVR